MGCTRNGYPITNVGHVPLVKATSLVPLTVGTAPDLLIPTTSVTRFAVQVHPGIDEENSEMESAQAIYQTLRAVNSGKRDYDPLDVWDYNYQLRLILIEFWDLLRTFKAAGFTDARYQNASEYVLGATSSLARSVFVRNYAEVGNELALIAARLDTLPYVPLQIYKTDKDLFYPVFVENSVRGGIFGIQPTRLAMPRERSEDGFVFTWESYVTQEPRTRLATLRGMINKFMNSTLVNLLRGDILNAYGTMGFGAVAEMDTPLAFGYSEVVCHAIESAFISYVVGLNPTMTYTDGRFQLTYEGTGSPNENYGYAENTVMNVIESDKCHFWSSLFRTVPTGAASADVNSCPYSLFGVRFISAVSYDQAPTETNYHTAQSNIGSTIQSTAVGAYKVLSKWYSYFDWTPAFKWGNDGLSAQTGIGNVMFHYKNFIPMSRADTISDIVNTNRKLLSVGVLDCKRR